jgi:ABC-type lipoprotein export system ATPase subunit
MVRLLPGIPVRSALFSIAGTETDGPLVDLRDVSKAYRTPAGDFPALKAINLTINRGQYVGLVGKSGSGKSTLINMLTGIDHPTSGEISIGGIPLHKLSETRMARWRGRNEGIVFQFFQLLPTLTVLENVVLPMALIGMYPRGERRERGMQLLDMVGIAEHAHKLPSAISGGQQQRVAIARALANDPPLIVGDEPTGNLDSRTAQTVFDIFDELVSLGKTLIIVTHDESQARRFNRTIVLADGEIVNEWLSEALPTLSQETLVRINRQLIPASFPPGHPIILQGAAPDSLYIITKGEVHIYLTKPDGSEIYVEALGPGQHFGEMALLHGGVRTATVRAARDQAVEVLMLDQGAFHDMIEASAETYKLFAQAAAVRGEALSKL